MPPGCPFMHSCVHGSLVIHSKRIIMWCISDKAIMIFWSMRGRDMCSSSSTTSTSKRADSKVFQTALSCHKTGVFRPAAESLRGRAKKSTRLMLCWKGNIVRNAVTKARFLSDFPREQLTAPHSIYTSRLAFPLLSISTHALSLHSFFY